MKEWLSTSQTFLQEAWAEFNRVQWPTRTEVRGATLVVIILVALIAVYLFIVDWILSFLLQSFLGK